MSSGTYDDLFDALGVRESSDNYQAENSAGFIGRYQMGELALDDAGYYDSDDGTSANDWIGTWAGKNGVNSKSDFLNDPAAQDAAVRDFFDALWGFAKNLNLEKYEGQTLNGVHITISGMLTGAHLVGIGGLKNYLESGGTTIPTDGNNTPITEYITLFADYDTPFSVDHSIAESIAGGTGDDTLDGGGGNDALDGGGGTDTIEFVGSFGDDTVTNGEVIKIDDAIITGEATYDTVDSVHKLDGFDVYEQSGGLIIEKDANNTIFLEDWDGADADKDYDITPANDNAPFFVLGEVV